MLWTCSFPLSNNPIKAVNWIYTIFTVSLGWVFFRSPNLYFAYRYVRVLFTGVPEALGTSIVSYFNADLLVAIITGILFCGVVQRHFQPLYSKGKDVLAVKIVEIILPISIFAWSLLLLFTGSYNPSIYGAF